MEKLFKSLSVCFILTLFFSNTTFAISESGSKSFDKRINIDPTKQWLIKLSLELDSNSIKDNISVLDKNHNKVDVTTAIDKDGKSIIVQAPQGGYKYGETYSLEVKSSANGIKSNSGKVLNQDAVMQFTIKDDPNTKVVDEIRGNTSGNLNNSGKMIQVGDWIYFNGVIYNKDIQGFYKMKLDGSSKTLLNDDDPYDINIVGDWIYYYDFKDDVFYKMKTDGSNKSKFIEDNGSNLNIVDGWAYYISFNKDTYEHVCRVKLDGSSKTSVSQKRAYYYDVYNGWVYFSYVYDNSLYKVKSDRTGLYKIADNANEVMVSKGWIYYTSMSDTDNTSLYKIDTDGNNKTKLSDNNVYNINIIGDYIYYIRFSNENNDRILSRIKVDGSEEKAIDNSGIYFFYSSGQWIYCQSYEKKNFKLKLDGTEKQSLYMPQEDVRGNTGGNKINYGRMAKSGDWIYYGAPNSDEFYKMKTDGSSKTLLNKDNPASINVLGDWIYYNNQNDLGLYKMKIDGTSNTKIMDEEVMDVLVVNDWIYYLSLSYDGQEYLCKVKLDGTSRTVLNVGRTFDYDVSEGWVYYNVYDDSTGLYKVKTDGTGKTTLLDELQPTKLEVSNGYIYYYDRSDQDRLYKILINGNEKLKLTNNNVSKPNVIGDYVYYINYALDSSQRVLYRVNIDGTGDKALDNTEINTIISAGEWIYCYGYNGIMFKIKPDGTGKQYIE
ncbi:hypothetical protein CLHOM_29380 [Clostridium homopropionicum DSM 5847]|uniref:DUF5050 domain-containing protein n=1 Tax=Clostridium homopropionicum DSM 5847 TaxID=1121318 RepID=A0A0L6Z6R5_9CLOT|nr:DUF5050 domain-containing protein [Clostridium homopropionicum]KOA18654.1 hypothetical protein CLHOM_29380 [Clostridium homopropionicum DSM 5847]SFG51545.1 protein of unknown function [Clostridium homopropionicum]